MSRHKVSDVFVPGTIPTYTYIPRLSLKLEERLRVAATSGKLVTVTGDTKSGKTVLTSKVYPEKKCIWIEGGSIEKISDFWQAMSDELEGFTDTSEETTLAVDIGASIEGTVGFRPIAGAAVAGSVTGSGARTTSRSRRTSEQVVALKSLRDNPRPVIVDDFHYIKRDQQGKIVRALKPLIMRRVPVIFIAIPHRRYDVARVEREMRYRVSTLEIPRWGIEELRMIADKGFPLLNMKVRSNIIDTFAKEAYGSPHLMQQFCLTLCTQRGVEESAPSEVIVDQIDDTIFKETASGTGTITFGTLAKGPRSRSTRKARRLQAGGHVDVYGATLLALSRLEPGLGSVQYERHIRGALREILIPEDVPQANEVTNVLDQLTEIARKLAKEDDSSTAVLEWDGENLHITDPFFAFFLKWGADPNLVLMASKVPNTIRRE